MELKEYWTILKKWWWLFLASTLVATVAGYLAVSRLPRIYQATTTVVVGQSLDNPNPSNQDLWISQQLAQTYGNMASRQPVLEGAAEAMGLPYAILPANVRAELVAGTQLMEISVRDTAPDRARAIADEIARQLILQTPNQVAEDQSRYDFVQAQLRNIEDKVKATEQEILAEQSRLDAASSARAIQQYQANVEALQQKLTAYQTTYATLLGTVQQRTNYIQVFERATASNRPVSPRIMETILLAAVTGLGLALAGAFLIELLEDKVKTPEDVQRLGDLPCLGTIGTVRTKDAPEPLIAARHPHSSVTEAYRALRLNIQVSSVDNPIHTLVVTSPSPLEGKSTTVANLGIVMAQAGKRVLLVDTDLRRATLHKHFQLSAKEGLTTVLLQDELDVADYLQETGIENLRLLASGPLPLNPSDLLNSQRMRRLIEKLKGQADIVLFDTPPVLPVTDAIVLALEADGVLLVTSVGQTRRASARQAVQKLRQAGVNILGVLLNRVAPTKADGYYYRPEPAAEAVPLADGPESTWNSRIHDSATSPGS